MKREDGFYWWRVRGTEANGWQPVEVTGNEVMVIGSATVFDIGELEGEFGGRLTSPTDAEREAVRVEAARAISGVDSAEAQRKFLESGGDPESTFVTHWHGSGMVRAFPMGKDGDR